MVDAGIVGIRELTSDEKKDMREVGKKTAKQKIVMLLKEKEQEYVNKYLPFSFAGAKIDIEDEFDRLEKEIERTGKVRELDVVKMSSELDFDKYGDAKRFKLLSMKPVSEDKLLDGIRASVITGYYWNYQDVVRGNIHISVFVPLEEHNKRTGKK
jgi:hypothetical protein